MSGVLAETGMTTLETDRLLAPARLSLAPYLNEKGHMEPAVFLVALVTVVGTAAFTIVKVARLWATRSGSPSADVTARLEELEGRVEGLQRELAETQERLDFAERILSNAREERRIGR